MGIDDILIKEGFGDAVSRLYDLMAETAGEELVEEMNSCFGSRERSRDWFYSGAVALKGKRPYDYCLEKKQEDVLHVVRRIKQGIYQ